MKLDDETLLTAYLDDELDEPQRRAVAAALQSDARLADQLHELVQVRALLAGLDRPETSYDLVGGVMVRIGAQSAGRWWKQVRLPAIKMPTAKFPAIKLPKSALAAAASLFILATLVLVFGHRPQQDRILNPAHFVTADSRSKDRSIETPAPIASSSVASLAPKPHEETVKEIDPKTAKPATLLAKSSPLEVAGPAEAELQSAREREQMLLLLDAPSVRRIFITGDTTETTASEVEGLLRNTPRRTPRFGRITVSQGIVVDPKNPNEAVVFILVMDEKELGYLRTRLERELHLSVNDDGDPPASVVTQLADVDQVTSFAGSPPSVVLTSPPPEVASPLIAIRSDENKDLKRATILLPSAPALPLGATDVTSSPRDGGGVTPAPTSESGKRREVARNETQPSPELSSSAPSGVPGSETATPSRRSTGNAAPASDKDRSTLAASDDHERAPAGVVDRPAAPPSNPDHLRTVLVWITARDTVRSSTQ